MTARASARDQPPILQAAPEDRIYRPSRLPSWLRNLRQIGRLLTCARPGTGLVPRLMQPFAHGIAGKTVRNRPGACGQCEGLRTRLRGRETERFGVYPLVVLGQDFTGLAGLVRDGAVADLAARDRKVRNRHGEAAGA